MIDLDAIKNRLAAVHAARVCRTTVRLPDHDIQLLVRHALMQGNTAHEAHGAVTYLFSNAPADIAALVEEVERLRGEQVRIMLEAERHRCIADEAIERIESAEAERAAVVAWLRQEAEASAQTYTLQAGQWANRIDGLADDIRRGEHRRGEKE